MIDCEDSVVIGTWNYTYLIAGPYETLQIAPVDRFLGESGEADYFQTTYNLWENTLTQVSAWRDDEPYEQVLDLAGGS